MSLALIEAPPPPTQLDIKLSTPQLKAYNQLKPGNTVFLGWGRGTGKSFFLRLSCWLDIAKWDGVIRRGGFGKDVRGIQIAWLMPHLKQFVDVHGAAILDELAPSGQFGFLKGKVNRTTWRVTFPGGSTILPFPAANVTARAARGVRADKIVADECDDIDSDAYDSVAVPWLSMPWSFQIALLGGTPTKGRYGLWYRMLEAGRKGDVLRAGGKVHDIDEEDIAALRTIYSSHATYADCPELVSAVAVAKAKATTPAATFAREWEADPDAGEGLVYPFDASFHIKPAPPLETFNEFHVGVDHGWTDPGVLLLIGVMGHGRDAIAHVIDEIYETECPNHRWDERARAWSNIRGSVATFWPDPSRPDRINDLRRAGVACMGVDNKIDAGIARVADMLFIRPATEDKPAWARLFVDPSCVNTIREFGLYRRKKRPDGSFQETPEDANNHCLDSARYVLIGRFGRGELGRHVEERR